MEYVPVVVVGSGFAGSILSRILVKEGLRVLVLERGRHPRFAIGESSTPLAALCLERLARRYGLEDLAWLAAYGRWLRHLPQLRRGLKRGFTFYRHHPGQQLEPTPDNRERLLVAASPVEAVADSHWLRADVDAFLVARARSCGVEVRESTEIETIGKEHSGRWRLRGSTAAGQPLDVECDLLVDASGAGAVLGKQLSISSAVDRLELDTGLVFSHLEGVGPLPAFEPGPYSDEQAAIHHLLEEGWMYVLPFDHGVVSAGILLHRRVLDDLSAAGIEKPDSVWAEIVGRYPTLRNQFRAARPLRPFASTARVQRLLERAAGEDWALLPHTFAFLDPMFSMGIAWSLLAVERLAEIVVGGWQGEGLDRARIEPGLQRYGSLLAVEVRQMAALLEGAYRAMTDFELFTAQSFLYFATVSYEEVAQRLFPEGRDGETPVWMGFLGADRPDLRDLFDAARERLATADGERRHAADTDRRAGFGRWIAAQIAPRNIAGLADPRRRNLYPVDLDLLVERADLLGLTPREMRHRLPLLRGLAEPA